ncbi:MAG: helix-turn-helix domain-containing protein [Shinella sp.]|nr:helix-turn-helix domain-containing protein [Shinella sp.]
MANRPTHAASTVHPVDLVRTPNRSCNFPSRERRHQRAFETPAYARTLNFPSQVRAARGLLNLTQQDLADISRVSLRTIVELERGDKQPLLGANPGDADKKLD